MQKFLRRAVGFTLTIAVAICLSEPTHGEPRDNSLADGRDAFDIDLPEGCGVSGGDGLMDFQVFHVTCAGVAYAGIYAGNAPDPSAPRSRLINTGFQWPSEIQVWSLLVSNDQERADRIAASVRLRRAKQYSRP